MVKPLGLRPCTYRPRKPLHAVIAEKLGDKSDIKLDGLPENHGLCGTACAFPKCGGIILDINYPYCSYHLFLWRHERPHSCGGTAKQCTRRCIDHVLTCENAGCQNKLSIGTVRHFRYRCKECRPRPNKYDGSGNRCQSEECKGTGGCYCYFIPLICKDQCCSCGDLQSHDY